MLSCLLCYVCFEYVYLVGYLCTGSDAYYPHDRKGGGLIVIIPDFTWKTLFECPIQIVFPTSFYGYVPHMPVFGVGNDWCLRRHS